jgi:hemolysin activation/secretion protein
MLYSEYSKWVCTVLAAVMAAVGGVAHAQQARFDILEYRVEGNSLITADQIEQAVSPYLGEGLGIKEVEAARASLEKRYHAAGYLTVQVSIPEQMVDSNEVTLQVTEASVSKLRVVGAQYHLPSKIKESVDEVAEGRVPNFLVLQERLSEVNKSADLKVAPVLKPGKTPGTVEVQLDVDDQSPLHGGVDISNHQSPNTTATRLAANVRYDNLWQSGQSLALGLQTSPENPRETRVLTANYLWPVGRTGDAISLNAVVSRSEFAVSNSLQLGNSETLGVRYALPLTVEPSYVQSMTFGLDHKNLKQSIDQSPNPDLQYMPLTIGYRGVWPGDQPQATVLDVNAILGLRGWLGNTDSAFEAKRLGASASFSALRSSLQLSRPLPVGAVAAKVEWQVASGRLLPSEQFVAGGADSVRGYMEGELSGDEALRFSFELSSAPVSLVRAGGRWNLTGLVFFDEALLRILQAGTGERAVSHLAGAGVGLRLQGPSGLGLQVDAASALTDAGTTRIGDWRVHGRLSLEF